jgi:hypothetical protein
LICSGTTCRCTYLTSNALEGSTTSEVGSAMITMWACLAYGLPLIWPVRMTYCSKCTESNSEYMTDGPALILASSVLVLWQVPEYFSEDLFQYMGNDRPDWRWLISGPAKSGSSFHKACTFSRLATWQHIAAQLSCLVSVAVISHHPKPVVMLMVALKLPHRRIPTVPQLGTPASKAPKSVPSHHRHTICP